MKNFRRTLSIVLISALIFITIACTPSAIVSVNTPTPDVIPTSTFVPTIEAADVTRHVTVNGLERSYLVHIPSGLNADQPVAVLLAFHGAGDTSQSMAASTGFNDIADQSGFLVVYPEGIDHTWNAGACCGYASANNVDDVAFVRQVVSDIESVAKINPKQIYATGFSNGGALVYRLGCEMSDVLAGIAPVASAPLDASCQPRQPISLIQLQGMADDIVPYKGGGSFNTPPIEDLIGSWATYNGCTGAPQTEQLVKIITHISYSSCDAGTAVDLYAIQYSGHAWQSMTAWSGSQAIWDFFSSHSKE